MLKYEFKKGANHQFTILLAGRMPKNKGKLVSAFQLDAKIMPHRLMLESLSVIEQGGGYDESIIARAIYDGIQRDWCAPDKGQEQHFNSENNLMNGNVSALSRHIQEGSLPVHGRFVNPRRSFEEGMIDDDIGDPFGPYRFMIFACD